MTVISAPSLVRAFSSAKPLSDTPVKAPAKHDSVETIQAALGDIGAQLSSLNNGKNTPTNNIKGVTTTSSDTGVVSGMSDESAAVDLDFTIRQFGEHASALKVILDDVIKAQFKNIDAINELFRKANILTEKLLRLSRDLERSSAEKNLTAAIAGAMTAIVASVAAAGTSMAKTKQYVSKTNELNKHKMTEVNARDANMLDASKTTGDGVAESNRALAMSAANRNSSEIAKIDHQLQIAGNKFQNTTALIASSRSVGDGVSQMTRANITRDAQLQENLSKEAAFEQQVSQKQVEEGIKALSQAMQAIHQMISQIQSSQEKLTAKNI